MTYDFEQAATIPAAPSVVYDAWLSSEQHTAMTGGDAVIDPCVGGEFTAWDGYISGHTVELEPKVRIVQAWRTTEFTPADADSIVEVRLEAEGSGTLLTLNHRNVPSDHRGYQDGGWQDNYFEPMIEYFRARPAAG
jgi:activator of HSP90 ATPase